MELLLPILLGFLACLVGGLYLLGVFRQRRPGEPPLDKGLIPWLGHVLEFRRNTLKFLERMAKKHGEIFTVQLGGFYITFVQDPFSFGGFVKESRDKLDFRKVALHLAHRVFGYKAVEGERRILRISSNKHLKGEGLEEVTQAFMSNLQNMMLHNIGSAAEDRTWKEDGLFRYSYNVVFRAGYLALFGNVPHKSEQREHAAKHVTPGLIGEDQLFPRLAYGVLPPMEKLAAERLKTYDRVKSIDMSMINRYMFVLLWASQSNIGPSSFWLLLFLMKHPEAMKAVKEEVDKVLKESGQEVRPGGPMVNLTREMLLKTPILDSAVEENLRLTAAPLLTRAVIKDMTFKMADGREYLLRKGDRIAIFPFSSVQHDPEIHPEPHSFKYDRFLNPDGTKKTDFYKAGKKVKYYTMPWGSGVSMCPGRFFATSELKQFVFLIVYDFGAHTSPKKTDPWSLCWV
uniref:Cytochrome P450 family 8 subfamily B member 1 n=1 Tax=Oreochromis niloticus TaxID=8128 RepID=A0A669C970_ORENI